MEKQTAKKIGSFITAIVLILLFVFGVGWIVKNTGIVDEYFGEFRLEYNEQTYKGSANILILPPEGEVRFEVKGVKSYTAEVVPNSNLNYSVDGKTYNFADEEITGAFISEKNVFTSCFVIANAANDFHIKSVLSWVWGRADIVINDELPEYPYRLVVTSADGERIEVSLGVKQVSLKLSSDSFYF